MLGVLSTVVVPVTVEELTVEEEVTVLLSTAYSVEGINIPSVKEWVTNYVMWVFNIYLDKNFPLTRDELTKKLKEKNIDTRDAFVPINQQQVLIDKYKLINQNDCPNANYIMENGFYLPSGNTITNDEIDYVCDEIIKLSK